MAYLLHRSRFRAGPLCHVLSLEAGWLRLALVVLVAIHKLLSAVPSLWA